MTAADYAEWCDVAGLYLGSHSHAERYRTFAEKISAAGLNVRIVHDFLGHNEGGIDVPTWRNAYFYEVGEHASYRLAATVAALQAVGATRLTEAVRSSRDTSIGGVLFDPNTSFADKMKRMEELREGGPGKMIEEFRANLARMIPGLPGMPIPEVKPVPPSPEYESREHVEHLLVEYVRRHERDLRADLERHGDPRREPGFTPERREEELQRPRQRERSLGRQREEAPAVGKLLDQIEARAAADSKLSPKSVADARREVLRCYDQYSAMPADDLVPEMRRWLTEARRVIDEYPRIFHPRPTDDPALLERLDAIGTYGVDYDGNAIVLRWDEPRGLACDWCEFGLTLRFSSKEPARLGRALDAYDRLRERWPEHLDAMRLAILSSFDAWREFLGRFGWDGYDLDDDGNPTAASILEHAGNGGVHIAARRTETELSAFFHVDWDDEHGLDVALADDDGG